MLKELDSKMYVGPTVRAVIVWTQGWCKTYRADLVILPKLVFLAKIDARKFISKSCIVYLPFCYNFQYFYNL